jgi:hypothetical protein
MNRRRHIVFAVAFVVSIAFCIATPALQAQMPGGGQASGFLGAWCAQGDPNKHASISGNGVFLTLTNENGDTSPGNLQGPNQIQAPGWQFVTGTLSRDGGQINWSNGTYWARCDNGGRRWTLTGTWFANGDRSRTCSIRQKHGDLRLQNESGQSASGNYIDRQEIVTNWAGTVIHGRVRQHGTRIDWDNGTYWVKSMVY